MLRCRCPSCEQETDHPDGLLGQKAPCGHCGQEMTVAPASNNLASPDPSESPPPANPVRARDARPTGTEKALSIFGMIAMAIALLAVMLILLIIVLGGPGIGIAELGIAMGRVLEVAIGSMAAALACFVAGHVLRYLRQISYTLTNELPHDIARGSESIELRKNRKGESP